MCVVLEIVGVYNVLVKLMGLFNLYNVVKVIIDVLKKLCSLMIIVK